MFIESTGMVCSVGLSAEASCAAIRAGIANFQELPFLDNQREPIVGSMVPGLASDVKCRERLGKLLRTAVADCIRDRTVGQLGQIPLIVGFAESDRPGSDARQYNEMIQEMVSDAGGLFHPRLSLVMAHGHTAGFESLRMAREYFRSSEISACVVCGVDSFINARSLLWLDQHQRLKTASNSDGIIPGEGAAAVLITKRPALDSAMRVKVAGIGIANEEATVLNEEPLLGRGLATATRDALKEAGILLHEADFRISDMAGESYGFREQALSMSRVMRSRREEFPVWHSSDCIGDVGAASGISQLVIYWHAVHKAYAPGKRAVCYTSAVLGARAVVVVTC